MLILGAGRKPGHYTTQPARGDVTIDKARSAGADHRLDLTRQPIPYPDGFFSEVYFEFFPRDQLLANASYALREAIRVTQAPGRIRIDTGKPTDSTELDHLRQEIKAILEAEGFSVTETPGVAHLQLDSQRGTP